MSTRDSLQVLLKLIESDKTKSYHGFMFDDASRLGRNLSEVLQFCKLCQFHGVFLYCVNQQLDSRNPNFYELIKNYASSDENFLKSLGHAVIRGQKGRIKAGMIHGGRYYGYKRFGVVVGTDLARELFPDYTASLENRLKFAAAVQRSAAHIADQVFTNILLSHALEMPSLPLAVLAPARRPRSARVQRLRASSPARP